MKRLKIIKNHLNSDTEVCIVAFGRSPVKVASKEFSTLSDSDLASQTIKGILEKYMISSNHIEEFYLGKVFSSNQGQALPKQILAKAGAGDHISSMSLNKLCASSMKAVTLAALSIACKNCECALAGGVESMSISPYLLNLRNGIKLPVLDSSNCDGFPDAVTKEPPLIIADIFSKNKGYTKEDLDNYAKISCNRAKISTENGKLKADIIQIVEPKSKKVIKDDTIKKTEGIEKSREVMQNGCNSAGNSCGVNDGAAFMVLCSRSKAVKEGWKVLGSIVSYSDAEQHARLFPSTPALAVQKALDRARLTIDEIDYMEINEPFACVVLENSKILKYPIEKINVYGGVISIGHPVGSSGCRIIGTLLNILHQEGGKYGVASICNAGGGGTAIIIKKE